MTFWDTFKGQPVFVIEEGGQYYVSTTEEGKERFWLDKLIELYNERPEHEIQFGDQKIKISELEPLLRDIQSFLSSIHP